MIYAIISLSVIIFILSIQNYWQYKINKEVIASLEFIKKIDEQQSEFNSEQSSFNNSMLIRLNKIDSENLWIYDRVKLLIGNNVG